MITNPRSRFSQEKKHLLEFHFSLFSNKISQTRFKLRVCFDFVFRPIMCKQWLCNGASDWWVEFQNKTLSQWQTQASNIELKACGGK